jgi:hypothetical protein
LQEKRSLLTGTVLLITLCFYLTIHDFLSFRNLYGDELTSSGSECQLRADSCLWRKKSHYSDRQRTGQKRAKHIGKNALAVYRIPGPGGYSFGALRQNPLSQKGLFEEAYLS